MPKTGVCYLRGFFYRFFILCSARVFPLCTSYRTEALLLAVSTLAVLVTHLNGDTLQFPLGVLEIGLRVAPHLLGTGLDVILHYPLRLS